MIRGTGLVSLSQVLDVTLIFVVVLFLYVFDLSSGGLDVRLCNTGLVASSHCFDLALIFVVVVITYVFDLSPGGLDVCIRHGIGDFSVCFVAALIFVVVVLFVFVCL